MLKKTSAIIEVAREVVDRAAAANPADRAFLEAAISAYLSAVAYAETEKRVVEILEAKFRNNQDSKIAHFLSSTLVRGNGRISKSDIADVVKKFGSDCKLGFNSDIDGRDETYYNNLLDCRHKLAHGDPKPETLKAISDGVLAAENLLGAMERAIK